MGFEEYTNRKWRVRAGGDPNAKHTEGDVVTFHGSEGKVEVKCKRYADGQYSGGTISGGTGNDRYTITMSMENGKRVISLTFGADGLGGIGGSWTAEDMPPGSDNG